MYKINSLFWANKLMSRLELPKANPEKHENQLNREALRTWYRDHGQVQSGTKRQKKIL